MLTRKTIFAVAGIGAMVLTAGAVDIAAHAAGSHASQPAVVRQWGQRDPGRDGDRYHRGARPERHPRIIAALRDLNDARGELQNADRDFHGYRQRALDATNRAIQACHDALESDRR